MKKILGLDLGTTSIGWALVNEAKKVEEKSSIIRLGVRVNPLTVDELSNFEKGKSITTNADRTLKRSMRRNLQRYKLRRKNLIEILKDNNFVSNDTLLSENGNQSTFETYRLRAKATTTKISLEQFARVLLMINKKRGYRSSRKAKEGDEGQLIDSMEVAKKLYNENLTPGQLCFQLLKTGKKSLPDFYRSDLQNEFDKIWKFQIQFYPEILTSSLKDDLRNKNEKATWVICEKPFQIVGIKRATKGEELKLENYEWRSKAISEKFDLERLTIVLQKINAQINSSSGYLGAISDRSKELYFNKQTVGQYQMAVLDENPNASLKNLVFYRQDYLDEFNMLWEKQAEFHKELKDDLKQEIRDVVIFYQRRLKSQKGLISLCEFENRQIEVEIDGKKRTKTVGSRVIPRSSPLFQEFKIWQRLNDIEIFPANEKKKKNKPNAKRLNHEQKELLFAELSIKEKLTKNQILSLLDLQEFDMNFNSIDGNRTQAELFEKYQEIIELSGYEIDLKEPVADVLKSVENIFNTLGYNSDILQFDSEIPLDEQLMYRLWHLLYSFEGDKSKAGNENLIKKLMTDYGFDKDSASILAKVTFQDDYGNLSAKSIRKILPHLKEGNSYDVACIYAGYEKHSKSSLTKEELEKKVYKNRLEIIVKNSLRNPVVEKVLNQMINVINSIIDTYGKPDEIRIELARELKKNADERFLLSEYINESTKDNDEVKERLKEYFGIDNPSRNDIIRYKLWQELAPNGYKPLYSSKKNENKEISPAILFSKEVDIEHIIPKAQLFDDSFSNKTLAFSSDNKDKGDMTAFDYVKKEFGEVEDYLQRIIRAYGNKTIKRVVKNKITNTKSVKTETKAFDEFKKEHIKNLKKKESREKWEKLGETEKNLAIIEKYYSGKLGKLAMCEKDIPDGFISRDLANTQYITKYAKTMLGDLVKFVICTTGSITERLREDWQLVDVMKELNWDKYHKLGLTEIIEKEDYDGNPVKISRIKDWTKRNDHRHHAMDALTVAFTKRSFIQYLNNLNARRTNVYQGISNTDNGNREHSTIITEDVMLSSRDVLGIEQKELYRDAKGKLRFKPPIPLKEFRAESKKHLENTLVSIKAKNKVFTLNTNTTKKSGDVNKKTQQTPRGQLHEETVNGFNNCNRIELTKKITKEEIEKIRCPKLRQFIKEHIKQKGSIEKAFSDTELKKIKMYRKTENTLWIPKLFTDYELKSFQYENKPLSKVIVDIPCYTKRIDVAKTFTDTQKKDSAKEKILKSVLDLKIREILRKRLDEYEGDFKKAFSNLDENPIWFNKEKGISIKRVAITGNNNAEALHEKRDKDGNFILDSAGKKIPVDFVNTGNNHHVAVYRKPALDKKGQIVRGESGEIKYDLEENVVSFYEAVARANMGLPIVDKEYKKSEGYGFLFTIKQNEYFIFPKTERHEEVNEETGEITEEEVVTFNPKDYSEDWFLNPENYPAISPNLFRVQKIATKNYFFRHHLETDVQERKPLRDIAYKPQLGLKAIKDIVKVRVNHIGQIVSVGEY